VIKKLWACFWGKNEPIAAKNALLWDVISVKTVG
jgi:hypothetical protein